MPTLAEFLKTENDRIREVQPRREAVLPEWRGAVEQLLTQIEGWVSAADKDGLLEITRIDCPASEETIGRYVVPGLGIRLRSELRDRSLTVVPKSRFTVARVVSEPEGRELPTAGLIRVGPPEVPLAGDGDFYRVVTEAGDRWYHHRTRWGRSSSNAPTSLTEYAPLTQSLFEQLLVTALR